MKVYQLKCPCCGASIEVEKHREQCYCSYCGTLLHLNDDIKRVEVTKKIYHHNIYTNEAKIKEIEMREKLQEQKFLAEKDKRNQKSKNEFMAVVVPLLLIAMIFLSLFFMIRYLDNDLKEKEAASIKQEYELQEIVDEILVDIENEDFSEAYVKAESLHYTKGFSNDVEKKWNSTRKELIKQIKTAEKEAEKAKKEELKEAERNAKKANREDTHWWNPFSWFK